MRKTKLKAIKTLSINLSVGINIGLLILLYSAMMLKSDLFKSKYSFVCVGHGYLKTSKDPLIINIDRDKVTLQIPYNNVRRSTLAYMEQSYGIHFSDKARSDFMETGIVSAPISQMRDPNDKTIATKPPRIDLEIPTRYKNSELNRWILGAREADVAFNAATLPIIVKADIPHVDLKSLNHVCDVLDDQHAYFIFQ